MNKLCGLRRMLSMLLALALALSLVTSVFAAESASTSLSKDELQGHWAEKQLREWVQSGLLIGDHNGAYNPDKAITRAELMSLINRSFGFTEKAEIHFTDINSSNWAYTQVAIAFQAGYTHGYEDNTIRADLPITREEAAVMIANAIKLDGDNVSDSLKAFSDAAVISAWGKPYIAALASQQLIHGTPAGSFSPQGQLTRAEAVTLLNQAMVVMNTDTAYSEAGDYGPATGIKTIIGNVVVSAPDVILRNTVILGNLTLTEGVGEGDASFNNVTVKGMTTIQGGGENSIHFEDSVLVRVVIDKPTGTVRVVAVGKSAIGHVEVNSPVKLEESHVTDSGFRDIELASSLPAGSEVSLSGLFENVSMFSSDIKVSIPSGSIHQLNVGEDANNTQIDVGAEAKVLELILNSVAKVLGQGTIDKATVLSGAKGSTFEKQPENVDGDAKDSVVVQQPAVGGGGSSTGGTNGSDNGANGGDDGGEDDGANQLPCLEKTDDACSNALLLDLSVEGYALDPIDNKGYHAGASGFAEDAFSYSVLTHNETNEQVEMTITKSVYSRVWVTVWDALGKAESSMSVTTDTQTISIPMQQNEDKQITISVTSGNLISSKSYSIFVQHPRTIQEAARIDTVTHSVYYHDSGNTEINITHEFTFGIVMGERILDDDKIEIRFDENSEPVLTYLKSDNADLSDYILGESGSLYVKIIRDDDTIAEGNYNYDFTRAEVRTEDLGLSLYVLTWDELFESFKQLPPDLSDTLFAYKLEINEDVLKSVFPTAGAVSYSYIRMFETEHEFPDGWTKERLKTNIVPRGINNPPTPQSIPYAYPLRGEGEYTVGGSYHPSTSYEADQLVPDAFIYVAVYDRQYNLLGTTYLVLSLGEVNLPEGYTPVHYWQSL